MADDADHAQVETEAEVKLTQAVAHPALGPLATASCPYCDEPLQNPKQLFCDDDCRHDYDALERALVMYRG
jgi:hypothetical protein